MTRSMSIAALRRQPPQHIVIRSFEGGIYLADIESDGQFIALHDGRGARLRERSIEAMRERLRDIPCRRIELLHHCAYEEMIGLGRGQSGHARVPLG